MYDLIYGMLEHNYVSGDQMQQYVLYICCTLICMFAVIFADAVRTVFSRFMFAGKK